MAKTITETTQENNSITLKMSAKGKYTWEIKAYGESIDEIMKIVNDADAKLKENYGED